MITRPGPRSPACPESVFRASSPPEVPGPVGSPSRGYGVGTGKGVWALLANHGYDLATTGRPSLDGGGKGMQSPRS
ncbi:hypothetical protein GCM10022206_71760 [Streptomyces chiangmaiensis]